MRGSKVAVMHGNQVCTIHVEAGPVTAAAMVQDQWQQNNYELLLGRAGTWDHVESQKRATMMANF